MTRRLAALLALFVLATGCGGGGGGGGDDDDIGTGISVSADEEKAQTVNLRLTDFPQGWERSRATVPAQAEADDRAFAQCMGRPDPTTLRVAKVDSDNFSTGELTRANSSVQVMRTLEAAKDDIAVLRTDAAVPCLVTRLQAELARQTEPGAPGYTMTGLARAEAPAAGDAAVAFRLTLGTTDALGRASTVYVDLLYVQKGRVEISASLVNPGTPFPADLSATLAEKMAERA